MKQTGPNYSPLHQEAEAQLAHAPKPKPKPRPAEELLHELQVHQIELEMQNEQLRSAQLALEESRDRYVDLYEFAPVGYLTLTGKGLISEINLTGSTLLKMERNKLLHRRFATFVAPAHRDRWNRLFVRVLQHAGSQNFELALENGDGESLQAHLDCVHLATDGKPPAVRIAFTDITERKKTDMALRESEERWAFAIESSGDGVWDWDLQTGKIVFSNRYKEILCFPGDANWDSIGDWKDRVNPEDMGRAMIALESYLDGKLPGYAVEYRMLCGDGGWKWMFARGIVVARAEDGRPMRMIGTHKDITERKQAERKLRDLATHVQTVREEEKARFAREIHDDLGGTLTALKMEAYWLAEELSAHEEATPLLKHIELMAQLVDDATGAMRRIITGMRPTILDDLGLSAAIEWHATKFCERTGIECHVNCVVDEGCETSLSEVQSINLFRIFQEALNNVTKHSSASRIAVEYCNGNEEVMLSVRDNGCGIPENHVVAHDSYGLLGMVERAEQLGGKIKFDSPPGGGFSVTVRLPLSAKNIEKEEA